VPIVPLRLFTSAESRALLHQLLDHGDIVGADAAGRTIIEVAVDDWVLAKLMTIDADAAELEDGATTSPTPMPRRMGHPSWPTSCGRKYWDERGLRRQAA
jgi:hypothetical protein